MSFAENTSVPVSKSRAEIESIITKYGATQFASGIDSEKSLAAISFKANDRQIRFVLPLPNITEKRFQRSPSGRKTYTSDERYKAWEQACRQRWRALALAIKAKLEAVACGITEFEDEFLAHIVLPNGQTMGQFARPQIAEWYDSGKVPPLMITGPTG